MIQFTQQQIEEQYKKLPAELKEAAYGVDIANKIYQIGQKFALTIEERGFLAEEALYVVLGLVRPEDFVGRLEERLRTYDEEAAEIAKEISQQVFLPLREALKRAHQMEIKEETPAAPAKPPEPAIPQLPRPIELPSKTTVMQEKFKPKIPPIDLRQRAKPQSTTVRAFDPYREPAE